MYFTNGKRGQVAIYVIVALAIISLIVIVYFNRNSLFIENVNPEVKEVLDYYETCIQERTSLAASLISSQGGKIYIEDFTPGSEYAPFSNYLNFLGMPVSYWYYVSSNGLIKENVPTKSGMEREIERYLNENLIGCDFQQFIERGFQISLDDVDSDVKINDNSIDVKINSKLDVRKEEIIGSMQNHEVEVRSKLGSFYKIALDLYNKQKSEAFLENYSFDVLSLHAPVVGVEIQCNTKTWKTREVVENIKSGLDANINSLRFKSNDFSLSDERNKYFVVDYSSKENIAVQYNPSWPSKIEIYGDNVDDNFMIAEPFGAQQGLGIIGFCYVPYQFVYDLSYPVMFQIGQGEEIFQFPVVVLIDKNTPRKGTYSNISIAPDFDLCEYNTKRARISLFDSNLNPIDGNVSFSCFDQFCKLGESKGGLLETGIPSCLNGFVNVKSSGYKETNELFSTNEESEVNVILYREHEVGLKVFGSGKEINSDVIVLFTDESGRSVGAVLPEVNKVKLSEGVYDIKAYAYSNSSLFLPETSQTKCTDVPKSGILGIFGSKKQECVEIKLPGTKIDYALMGGGESKEFLLESELERGEMNIYIELLARPNSLEDLQNNFALLDGQGLEVGFNE